MKEGDADPASLVTYARTAVRPPGFLLSVDRERSRPPTRRTSWPLTPLHLFASSPVRPVVGSGPVGPEEDVTFVPTPRRYEVLGVTQRHDPSRPDRSVRTRGRTRCHQRVPARHARRPFGADPARGARHREDGTLASGCALRGATVLRGDDVSTDGGRIRSSLHRARRPLRPS